MNYHLMHLTHTFVIFKGDYINLPSRGEVFTLLELQPPTEKFFLAGELWTFLIYHFDKVDGIPRVRSRPKFANVN